MANHYENPKTNNEGIHYSRYVISWLNAKAKLNYFGDDFVDWLKTRDIDEEEFYNIVFMARTGKFELEQDAIKFLKNKEES